jgi:tRNA-dihydrouridine synthase 1
MQISFRPSANHAATTLRSIAFEINGNHHRSLHRTALKTRILHIRPASVMARHKLHGRAFYESLGSPKHILAPMVDQSEFAWRLLTRSFLPPDLRTSILAYSPMLHAKLFAESPKYRASHFEPLQPPLSLAQPGDSNHSKTFDMQRDAYMDGNPKIDRPLFVQFCANDPEHFLEAAKIVQPYCDAVDLNLGCPQGIARRGNYGSFLQEDWGTIHNLIRTLHEKLDIPVTAKMRVLETKEKTLEYAKMVLSAGASIITVHGRRREQKGHNTGLADWSVLRYLRDNLPPETVIFANGNILQHDDIERCLEETQADGVMSAEGNLYDPAIFATAPAVGDEGREYFRTRDGYGGWRCDAVLRRYLDIIHRYVMRQEPPVRQPLFVPSDEQLDRIPKPNEVSNGHVSEDDQPPSKKQKLDHPREQKPKNGKQDKVTAANLVAMQAHCFHILRPLVSQHHDVRDALARSRAGDIPAYENVLTLTEKAVREGLMSYERDPSAFGGEDTVDTAVVDDAESSVEAVKRCKRPYWVCQPYVRPLPKEALEKGSLQLSKKDKKRLAKERGEAETMNVASEGAVEDVAVEAVKQEREAPGAAISDGVIVEKQEIPREGLVCG